MSLAPCVISSRVRVGSADNLTIVFCIDLVSRRARRGRRRHDGGRALGGGEGRRRRQVVGSVSRHARGNDALSRPERAVPIAVICAAFHARLVPGVAPASRRQAARSAVLLAAVDLSAITARADHEERHAPRASPFAPDVFRPVRHRRGRDTTLSCPRPEMGRRSSSRAPSCSSRPRAQAATWALSFSVVAFLTNATDVRPRSASSRPVSAEPDGRLQVRFPIPGDLAAESLSPRESPAQRTALA